ncbi:MAG: proton-conducting transporter membrane subunit, partial [Verrucomicrobiota bacterium]
MEAAAITLPILIPLLLSLVVWFFRASAGSSRILLPTGMALLLGASVWLFSVINAAPGPIRVDFGGWEKPLGISFKVDLFASIMVIVAAVIGFSGSLFAMGEIGRLIWKKGYGTFFFLLLAGINGAFLTNDLFNLFVWFEVMLMASFAMLVLGRRKFVFEGATKYVVINMISSFFFLSGLGLLYGKTGQLNLDEIALGLGNTGGDPVILSTAALFLMAFGIKA